MIDEDDDLGGSLGSFRGGALSSSNALSVASPDQVALQTFPLNKLSRLSLLRLAHFIAF